jgi:tyrosyl-tRNA synthetase
MPETTPAAVVDELKARSLLHQCTDEDALRAHLATPRRLYTGFDPTADSLTIGNLVPMMMLRHFRAFGHTPVVLMGGATGRIGDPSGKDAERQLMTDDVVDGNIAAQRLIFQRVLGGEVEIVNNHDWFKSMDVYTFLRDIGKHFSINQMIQRDAVRNRLEDRDHGISYTEFSYMLLQAYDFLHLYRTMDVTLQTAGADQWGNIVSGVDLVRRAVGLDDDGNARSFGWTCPLLTKADGSKFGKTESGAIWLSHERPSGQPGTSAYAYYQFWINTADADVERYLHIFSDRSIAEITDIMRAHTEAPHQREAQRTLARDATTILHGEDAVQRAEAAAGALFSGDVAGLDEATIDEVFADVPASTHTLAELGADGMAMADVLAATSLVKSKREARDFLGRGAVSLNGRPVGLEDRLTATDLLHGRVALLRRGKKSWHVARWS